MIIDGDQTMFSRKKGSFATAGKLKSGGLAVLLCIFSTVAAAAPVTGDNAKVVMCLTSPQQGRTVFNPLTEYGNPIRFTRTGEPLIVITGEGGFTFDLDGAIVEAMAEWTAAVPSLRFQSIPVGLETPKTWRVRISEADVARLGSGFRIGARSPSDHPELVFYYKGFWKAAQAFQANAHYMASDQLLHYLAFLLRITVKHEVGHMLGFMHPPIAGEDEEERDATGCATQAVFEPLNIAAGPPIMARNLATTLQLMREYYGRPLGINDIQIAPQEAAIARAVFEQPCPVNIEQPNNAAPRANGTPSYCPKVSRFITPSLAPVYELLAD